MEPDAVLSPITLDIAAAGDVIGDLVDQLQDARDSLLLQAEALDAVRVGACASALVVFGPVIGAAVCDFDVGELRTRADAARTMAAAVERAAERVPAALPDLSPERQAEALDSMARILDAIDAEGFASLAEDVRRLASDIVDDARTAVDVVKRGAGGFGVGAGIVAAGVGLIALRGLLS